MRENFIVVKYLYKRKEAYLIRPTKLQIFTAVDQRRFNSLVENHQGLDADIMTKKGKLSLSKKRLFYQWLVYSYEGCKRVSQREIGWSRQSHKGRPPLFVELWGHEMNEHGELSIPDVKVNQIEEEHNMPSAMMVGMANDAAELDMPSELVELMRSANLRIVDGRKIMKYGYKALLERQKFEIQEERLKDAAETREAMKAMKALTEKVIKMVDAAPQPKAVEDQTSKTTKVE